jgi:hypothetical protein
VRFFKKKIVKEIYGGVWGCLVNQHGIDVDTIAKELRCVEREGTIEGGSPVTFLRIFKPKEAETRSIDVAGWETLDQHPDLVLFEGYLTKMNEPYLQRKRSLRS